MLSENIQSVSERLADPTLSEAERQRAYTILSGFNEQLRLRDLERREALVHFSNGLTLPNDQIAAYCKTYSVADFCITHGLTRAEVLERTGLARAGVR